MISITTSFQSGVSDDDLDMFMFVIFGYSVKQCFDAGKSVFIDEYASLGVFGARSPMDPNPFSIRHLVDERHEFFESRRVGHQQGVCAFRDEEVGVLEGRDRDVSVTSPDGEQ